MIVNSESAEQLPKTSTQYDLITMRDSKTEWKRNKYGNGSESDDDMRNKNIYAQYLFPSRK